MGAQVGRLLWQSPRIVWSRSSIRMMASALALFATVTFATGRVSSASSCYIAQCGCPPFPVYSWCSPVHSVISSSWCVQSEENCERGCNGKWCQASATTYTTSTRAITPITLPYTCGNTISGDCQSEYENQPLGQFCGRCGNEGGASPLRSRCELCCRECSSTANPTTTPYVTTITTTPATTTTTTTTQVDYSLRTTTPAATTTTTTTQVDYRTTLPATTTSTTTTVTATTSTTTPAATTTTTTTQVDYSLHGGSRRLELVNDRILV